MPLEPITHSLLDRAGVRHGFFTRQGGVSAGLYEGLNTGVGSKDEPAAVAENRRRVAAHLGGVPDDLAACVTFLCSPEADMIRGQTLVVDGGWSLLTNIATGA